ncbi:hypothetical protein [Burkholderia sp. BCC0398]|uniref:hypothetical protein n=1 Tax=Burkholderia sp. BCC0398 TaxID=2676297 RepID=UPI00158DB9BA|nr:hypothetical protein [Burkholderia sp. BCC0398]
MLDSGPAFGVFCMIGIGANNSGSAGIDDAFYLWLRVTSYVRTRSYFEQVQLSGVAQAR